jgi:hypothetical protein
VDIFWYTNTLTGQTSSQQFEVEVEAKNEHAVERLPLIKKNLLFLLSTRAKDFHFSEDTKYERGVRLLGLSHRAWVQRLSAWATSPAAGLANLSIGVLSLLLTIFFGIVGIVLAYLLVK